MLLISAVTEVLVVGKILNGFCRICNRHVGSHYSTGEMYCTVLVQQQSYPVSVSVI